jgi:poly-beta-1,6 N-acetyl-D-glucosamine synthase
MEIFFLLLFTFSLMLLFILMIKVGVFLYFSISHLKRSHKHDVSLEERKICFTPSVSIIVPAYNEELVLKNCIASLAKLDYPTFEIIIIDDGSKDKTAQIGQDLTSEFSNVKFYTKENGGKALALNYGVSKAHSEIIVCIDADSILQKDALWHITLPFYDRSIGAVGGNVKVVNRENLLNLHQALEYIVGLNIQRRAFSHLDCMQVISGAIGAFRRDVLNEVGGYSHDSLVEDMDITIAVQRAGYRVVFASKAIAYTESPESITDFIKQRRRWTLGGFKVIYKYRDMLFNRKYGQIGVIGLPYFLIFPWVDVMVSFMLILSLVSVFLSGNFLLLLLVLVLMVAIQMILVIYALRIDDEPWYLVLLVALENIWFSHMINVITVISAFDFITNKKTYWNKVTRLGKNIMPSSSAT